MPATRSPHRHRNDRRKLRLGRAARWSMVAAWAAVIFAASSLPGSNVPGRFGTLAHFVEYAVLGGSLFAAIRLDALPARAATLAVLAASGYGVTDELHQMLTPGRVPDVMDWVVDTLGAAVGVAAAYLISTLHSRRQPTDQSRDDAP